VFLVSAKSAHAASGSPLRFANTIDFECNWEAENGHCVRRQLLFPVDDNYFSLRTTYTAIIESSTEIHQSMRRRLLPRICSPEWESASGVCASTHDEEPEDQKIRMALMAAKAGEHFDHF
jgi:hypothetical protein